MSLQHLKKNKVKEELNFLYDGKHQSFGQVYFNTFRIKVSYKTIL